MDKLMSALMAATFIFGLSTEEVDAKVLHKHHNYMWHKGHHYKTHKKIRHHAHHRKAHKYARLRHVAQSPVVVAHIHIASQRMSVDVNGNHYGDWVVSTAGRGYSTPRGSFGATRMARTYFSKKYDNSPMPYSIFFYGGNAIHGITHLHSLRHPASHGCVRLHPAHAAELFSLVSQYGMNHTRIIVSNL